MNNEKVKTEQVQAEIDKVCEEYANGICTFELSLDSIIALVELSAREIMKEYKIQAQNLSTDFEKAVALHRGNCEIDRFKTSLTIPMLPTSVRESQK